MNTKYTVLMSVYIQENADFLDKSLESIINQTIKPNQIVLVKDGPLTAELNAVLENYVKKYNALFTIVGLDKNMGLGLALNEGINYCENELIARMDTDDIALDNRMELQIKEFKKDKELCIVGTQTYEFSKNPKNIEQSRVVPLNHDEIFEFSKRRSPFNHPTVMYKKSCVLSVGAYRDVKRNEDLDLFIRMLNNGAKAKNLPNKLLLFRASEDNYLRRKTWENCSIYIKTINYSRKIGHSSFFDLFHVAAGQIFMYMAPTALLKFVSKKFLRTKVTKNEKEEFFNEKKS